MYLYNSLSHKKELFVPNSPDVVKMYTCGPTVYHFAGCLVKEKAPDIHPALKIIWFRWA